MIEITATKNSQLLYFPLMDCTIAAGYKNNDYKKNYGYIHYGIDFDTRRAIDYNNVASGNGVVLGVEFNQKNSIGGVIVIKYPKVYIPATKQIKDVIVRIYHMDKVLVKKGDKVKPYQVIGTVSGSHKWWNHTHLEIDTDIKYPFFTPQVAEVSSKLLVRKGATDKTLLNPIDVLVIGKQQKCIIHPKAVYVDSVEDQPKYKEK